MRNEILNIAASLVMGSFVIFSGQALAFSSSNQELSHAEALGESEILIAQNGESNPEDFEVISPPLPPINGILGNLEAKLNSVDESDLPGKNVLAQILGNLKTVIGNIELASNARALTRGQGVALAEQAINLVTTVGDLCAELRTTAKTEEGRAVAECCAPGSTILDNIVLHIESIAQSGF